MTLTLIEEDRASTEWTGWFHDPEGHEFGVTLRPLDGRPYRVRVAHRATGQGRSLPSLFAPSHDGHAEEVGLVFTATPGTQDAEKLDLLTVLGPDRFPTG